MLECHLIAGGFDYLVKARVRDMEAYREFLSEVLMTLPGCAGNAHLPGDGGGEEHHRPADMMRFPRLDRRERLALPQRSPLVRSEHR